MSINSHHAGNCGEGKGLRPELRGADLDGRELRPGGARYCARLPHSENKGNNNIFLTELFWELHEKLHKVLRTVSATKRSPQNVSCYYSKNYAQITTHW